MSLTNGAVRSIFNDKEPQNPVLQVRADVFSGGLLLFLSSLLAVPNLQSLNAGRVQSARQQSSLRARPHPRHSPENRPDLCPGVVRGAPDPFSSPCATAGHRPQEAGERQSAHDPQRRPALYHGHVRNSAHAACGVRRASAALDHHPQRLLREQHERQEVSTTRSLRAPPAAGHGVRGRAAGPPLLLPAQWPRARAPRVVRPLPTLIRPS